VNFWPRTRVPTPSLGQVMGVPFQLIQGWVQERSGGSAGVGHSLDLSEVTVLRTSISIGGFVVRTKCVDPDAVPGKWCGHF
jgi:hypothetical protein